MADSKMAINTSRRTSKKYDFYIVSDDNEWLQRILNKLKNKHYSGYYKGNFILGRLKPTSRFYGVENSLVTIIGFPPPSKKTTETDEYVAALAIECRKNDDLVMCIPTAKDSKIPDGFSPVDIRYEDILNEDNLCDRIAEAIEDCKSGGSLRRSDTADPAGAKHTGDTVNSATGNQDPPRENMPADAGDADAGDTVDSATGNQDPPRDNTDSTSSNNINRTSDPNGSKKPVCVVASVQEPRVVSG